VLDTLLSFHLGTVSFVTKTDHSFNPLFLCLQTHVSVHSVHTKLDFWDCITLGHFCLRVCSCVVLNYHFGACTGCQWEVFFGFYFGAQHGPWKNIALDSAGKMMLGTALSLSTWPSLWVPSSNVRGFWTLAMFGIRKETPPVLDSRERWIFASLCRPVIYFLGLSGNAICVPCG